MVRRIDKIWKLRELRDEYYALKYARRDILRIKDTLFNVLFHEKGKECDETFQAIKNIDKYLWGLICRTEEEIEQLEAVVPEDE